LARGGTYEPVVPATHRSSVAVIGHERQKPARARPKSLRLRRRQTRQSAPAEPGGSARSRVSYVIAARGAPFAMRRGSTFGLLRQSSAGGASGRAHILLDPLDGSNVCWPCCAPRKRSCWRLGSCSAGSPRVANFACLEGGAEPCRPASAACGAGKGIHSRGSWPARACGSATEGTRSREAFGPRVGANGRRCSKYRRGRSRTELEPCFLAQTSQMFPGIPGNVRPQ
jgi:hypothetical protein